MNGDSAKSPESARLQRKGNAPKNGSGESAYSFRSFNGVPSL